MSTFRVPMCLYCKHFDTEKQTGLSCEAFPERIPDKITQSQFDHRKAYPNDNGIRFKAIVENSFDFSFFSNKNDRNL